MKQLLLSLIFISGLAVSYGQPHATLESLGLTDSQLQTAYEKGHLLLSSNSSRKKKKIKEGGFAIITLTGDTTKIDVILEAFLADTIIVSTWAHNAEGNDSTLHVSELKLVPIKSIETIEYNVRHESGVFWTSFIMVITGFNFAVLPVVMPLIVGTTEEVYSQPQFPFIVVGGAVLFVGGIKLQRMLNPKVYNLRTDWSYEVRK